MHQFVSLAFLCLCVLPGVFPNQPHRGQGSQSPGQGTDFVSGDIRRFSGHGVSFDYPNTFTVREDSSNQTVRVENRDFGMVAFIVFPESEAPVLEELQQSTLNMLESAVAAQSNGKIREQRKISVTRKLCGANRTGQKILFDLGDKATSLEVFAFFVGEKGVCAIFHHKTGNDQQAEKVFSLVGDSLSLDSKPGPVAKVSGFGISGKLSDSHGPITAAQIEIQRFADEKCARLFASKEYDEKNTGKLAGCTTDLPGISVDQQGHYLIGNLEPGWYAIHFRWDAKQKPKSGTTKAVGGEFITQGEMTLGFYETRDSTGKYNAMGQGVPFYFSGKENVIKDFSIAN